MNKIITCYNELAAQLYHIYNEHKTPYFSGHIQVEDIAELCWLCGFQYAEDYFIKEEMLKPRKK